MPKTAISSPTGVCRGWSDNDLKIIKELIEGGKSMRGISRLFGVSHRTINRLNEEHKWKEFPRKKQTERVESLKEKIKKLYLLPPNGEGLSAMEIGQQLNISPTSVRNVLNRIGEKVRSPLESFTDKRREKIIERNILYWANPENKQKMRDFWEGYWAIDENKENFSKIMKEVWKNNPHLREDDSQRMKERWKNYPGGFAEWISQFPIEKQKEILNAMNAPK